MRELPEEAFYEEMLQREAEDNYPLEEDTGLAEPCMLSADISLEDQLANIGVSFHDKLFELIDESHLDNRMCGNGQTLIENIFQRFNVTRIIIQRRQ